MSCAHNCGCGLIPREQADAVVHRILAGEVSTLIAFELGLEHTCVELWPRDHRSRHGKWQGLPLSDADIAAGYEMGVQSYEIGRLKSRNRKPSSKRDSARRVFMLAISSSSFDRTATSPEEAYARLESADRALFAPAFDVYLHAMQHLAEVRRLQKLAIEVASGELGAGLRSDTATAIGPIAMKRAA